MREAQGGLGEQYIARHLYSLESRADYRRAGQIMGTCHEKVDLHFLIQLPHKKPFTSF